MNESNGPSWQTVVLTIALAVIAAIPSTLAYFKTAETHDLVNSRLDAVLPLIKKGAADEATLKEKDAQKMREGAAAIDSAKPKKP